MLNTGATATIITAPAMPSNQPQRRTTCETTLRLSDGAEAMPRTELPRRLS